ELRDLLDGIEVRVKGLIGYLPLTSHIVLNLVPKFPIANLWRMLEVADTEYDCIYPVLRSYQAASAIPPHEMLARGFCHYLRSILTVGIARGYFLEDHRGHYRPKVQFGRTVSSYLARGDGLNVASDSFNFSTGIYPNAVLKSACMAFLHVMPGKPEWNQDRELIGEALNALGMVKPERMQYGDQAVASMVPAWLRDGYRGALMVYSMLLGYSRIGFAYEALGTEMPSFLFSLDDIFESYVRNTFREALAVQKIAVLDGNKPQHHGRLFLDNRRYPTKPDLIFKQKKLVIGLGEVKYKPGIDESDRYQVLSHVLAAGCKVGVWISPAAAGKSGGLEYVGSVSTGAKFYHYQLDIGGDLDVASATMVEKVAGLLPT
ncbi:MAG: McrC family protein, partial [Proteobacteria bacterium]|nr:McrC family protein [Pseudomonadota bacterium]